MRKPNITCRAARAAAAAMLLCGVPAAADDTPPTGLWQLTDGGYVRVLVFRGGLFGRLGHNHVVTHRALRGCARVDTELSASRLYVELPVATFTVDETSERRAAGERFPVPIPADAAAATRRNMLGPELLDADEHPSLKLRSRAVRGSLPDLEIEFDLYIAGQTRRLALPAAVSRDATTMTVSGTRSVTHAELGLTPYSAAFGTLRVADELVLRYALTLSKADGDSASNCERALAVVDDDLVAPAHDGAE